ncbi:MAG: NAD(P)/FAD-dependent oxidoreductase [Balneola sp.]
MSTKVVIVGGGFAGLSVAKQLYSKEFDVTIIDKTNHHVFQPLLYQVATAALSPGDIAIPIRAIFSKRKNIKVLLGEVTSVDTENNFVNIKGQDSLPFDYLILAPGTNYNYFGNDQWKEYAPGLKTISNALDIREKILVSLEKAEQVSDTEQRKKHLTYVIIGGGPTGVEMAGSIAEIAKRNMMRDYRTFDRSETNIYLVEAADGILNGYPSSLSKKARWTLEGMGVEVLLNSPVEKISSNKVLVDGKEIESDNIIWAAGNQVPSLISNLDEPQDRMGRIKVNKDLSVTKNKNMFVIGDASYFENKEGTPLPGIAPVALQQGKFLGKLIKHEVKKGQKRDAFSYLDKGTMATIGRAKAVANIRGFTFSGLLAWFMWGFIHIFFLIGFRNRFRVFAEWVWHYLTFKRGVRLITHDEDDE